MGSFVDALFRGERREQLHSTEEFQCAESHRCRRPKQRGLSLSVTLAAATLMDKRPHNFSSSAAATVGVERTPTKHSRHFRR
jgi:hypothetical protein